jgi:hypothetical protein
MIPIDLVEADYEYHVVELHSITHEVISWLNKQFGPPTGRWWISHYKVYFKDERDHLMFLLRWA